MSGAQARRVLVYIPIVHSQADMGSLGRALQADQVQARSVQTWWIEIQQQVRALELSWPGVKVYQDGLPDTNAELIRKILAEVQSPNYDLLRWLVSQGAELVGTESPALLMEEYLHLQAVLTPNDSSTRGDALRAYARRAGELLAERDAYIARRIADTLPPDRVGFLFVGQAHRVAKRLAADIAVRRLPRTRASTKATKLPAL